jgi:hypothetical protein
MDGPSIYFLLLVAKYRIDIYVGISEFVVGENINKQKYNEMHLDCLLYHLIPPTCFGQHRPSSVWCYKIPSKII